MLEWIAKRHAATLGIDIQPDEIGAVMLRYVRKNPILIGYTTALIPPQTGTDPYYPAQQALEQVFEDLALKPFRRSMQRISVVIAIPESAVSTHTFSVPKGLSADQIAAQIAEEACHILPWPLEDLCLDFQSIGPTAEHPNWENMLWVATQKIFLEQRVALFKNTGFEVSIVDVENYAQQRCAQWLTHLKNPAHPLQLFIDTHPTLAVAFGLALRGVPAHALS